MYTVVKFSNVQHADYNPQKGELTVEFPARHLTDEQVKFLQEIFPNTFSQTEKLLMAEVAIANIKL